MARGTVISAGRRATELPSVRGLTADLSPAVEACVVETWDGALGAGEEAEEAAGVGREAGSGVAAGSGTVGGTGSELLALVEA